MTTHAPHAPPEPPEPPEIEVAEEVSATFADLVPREFARARFVCSEGLDAGTGEELVVASESTPPAVLHNIGARLRRPLRVRRSDAEGVARTVDALYERHRRDQEASAADPARARRSSPAARGTPHSGGTSGGDLARLLAAAESDLLNLQGKGEVARLVDAVLFEALGRGASDVHLQPLPTGTLVRIRVDGVLHDVREIATEVAVAVTSRIKVMGRMDIAERRVPQDGRATVTIGDRPADLRISTVPTSHGERVVVRLLDRERQPCSFAALGMPAHVESPYLDRASRTNGIILVTGPTGSGKTTTLYATLGKVGASRVNVMTIEDPIEYELSLAGVRASQSQVNQRKGVTFATGLRHILRQDPDVVMVGEIRDEETARTAIQASLTGHLVLSTLHTNDAPSAVTRLVDLGVEPYLVAASLSAVLAQRLVRTVHAPCAGAGCAGCLGSGLLGRTGVYELLVVDESLRALVSRGADTSELRDAARRSPQWPLRTLADEGARLVSEGASTQAEVDRVLMGAI